MASADLIQTSSFSLSNPQNRFVDDMLALGMQHIMRAETLNQMKHSFSALAPRDQVRFIRKSDPAWMEELATSANNMLASRLGQSFHAMFDNPPDEDSGLPARGLPPHARHHVPIQVDYLFGLRMAFNHPERLSPDPQRSDSLKYLLVTLKRDLHDLVRDWREHPMVPRQERQLLAGALQLARSIATFDPLRLEPESFGQALDHAIAFHEMRAGAALKAAIAEQKEVSAPAPKLRQKKVADTLSEAAYDAIPTTLPAMEDSADKSESLEEALERAMAGQAMPAGHPSDSQNRELERLIAGSLEKPTEFAEEAMPSPATVRPGTFQEMQGALLGRRWDLAHLSQGELPSPSFVDRLDKPNVFSGLLNDTLKARQATPPSMSGDYFCIMTRLKQLEMESYRADKNARKFFHDQAAHLKKGGADGTPGR